MDIITPPRPQIKLPDLAEAIIEAVAAKQLADIADASPEFGDWADCQLRWSSAERALRAMFADIGISPAYLKLLKEIL